MSISTLYVVCYVEKSLSGGKRFCHKEILARSVEDAATYMKHMVGPLRFELSFVMKAQTFKTDKIQEFKKRHQCQKNDCQMCLNKYEELFQSGK